jgi:hypothetical protein
MPARPLAAAGALAVAVGLVTAVPAAAPASGSTPSRVLLNNNFNSMGLGRVRPAAFVRTMGGGSKSSGVYDDSSVVAVGSRGRALRTTLWAHTMHNNPSGNNGIVNFVHLKRVVNRACVSYQIRFSKGFDWSLGGKLPGLLGVTPGTSPALPTGGNDAHGRGWSGRLMWLGPKAYSSVRPLSNEVVSYMYHPGQRDKYGDNVWWHRGFTAGKWNTVRQCYAMNTIGRRNGKLRAWLDGHLVVNRTNYTFRTRRAVHITHLSWSIFRGGHTSAWAGSTTGSIDIDNLRVTVW